MSRYINNITVAFGFLLLPTMSAMHAKSQINEMKKISKIAERYISLLLMPVVFLMIFLAKPIIWVFLSKQFFSAIPILQILPLFALFDALEKPYAQKYKCKDCNQEFYAWLRIRRVGWINKDDYCEEDRIPKDVKLDLPIYNHYKNDSSK